MMGEGKDVLGGEDGEGNVEQHMEAGLLLPSPPPLSWNGPCENLPIFVTTWNM